MKAKYKNTGEIVEIDTVSIVFKDITNDKFCRGDEIDFVTEIDIDWEQRRYEIAKSVLQGFCANSEPSIAQGTTFQQITGWSIEIADILIAELKKGGSNGSH